MNTNNRFVSLQQNVVLLTVMEHAEDLIIIIIIIIIIRYQIFMQELPNIWVDANLVNRSLQNIIKLC
jgi:hypothetical protein